MIIMNSAEMLLLVMTNFLYILVRCPDVEAAAFSVDNESTSYTWKTGSWNTCFSPNLCGDGRRHRKVWCYHSSGFLVDDSNCKPSERPDAVGECFRVCKEHKDQLRWSIGPWSPCNQLSPILKGTCPDTIPGTSTRQVDCMYDGGKGLEKVVDNQACEYFRDKPVSRMSCSLDCPQDCVTAKRNVSCSVCGGNPSTVQVTDIVVFPQGGGRPCMDTDNAVCPSNPDASCEGDRKESYKKYFLKVSQWSPCVAKAKLQASTAIQIGVTSVIGLSTRNVTCLSADGEVVDISKCSPFEFPHLKRRCVVPQDCRVSPWSEWRVVSEGCVNANEKVFPEVRTRTRSVVQLPVGDGARHCPLLFERREVTEGLLSCQKYKWFPLPWTECEVRVHGLHGNVQIIKPACGSGIQYRNVTCLRANDMSPSEESLCLDPFPGTTRRCEVGCRRDCVTSSWSKWGWCLAFNNTNFMQPVKSGYRTRSRSVIVNPSQDGQPCPHLHEVESCDEIEVFQWKYGTWSECVLSDLDRPCGVGVKTRDATCVFYNGSPMGTFYCRHHVTRDDVNKDCLVPCPNDCLVSQWSTYSPCSQKCFTEEEPETMRRNRTVLAIQGEGGANCSRRLHQEEECDLDSCKAHRWRAGPWGSCVAMSSDNSTCGVGLQKRTVECVDADVDEDPNGKLCEYIPKMETERECDIPCPVDCVVSYFSDWAHCNASCDSDAVQYRHRVVLQPAVNGGKPCPEGLVEARPCSLTNDPFCLQKKLKAQSYVYSWSTGQWGPCLLPIDGTQCGTGMQVRNLRCVDLEGREVEPHYCLPIREGGVTSKVPPAVRSCEVTCAVSCALTTWSEWSDCGLNYQPTRSRHRELISGENARHNCRMFPLTEEDLCPAVTPPEYNGHWMSCIVQEENRTSALVNGVMTKHDCGDGSQYRAGFQMDSDVEMKLGVQDNFCFVDCPLDCQMSPWSEWSPCDIPCGHGFSSRKRHVLVPANELGRPCPLTVNQTEIQRKVCSVQCSDFYWFSFGWSECQLSDISDRVKCGDGKHYRTVVCLDRRTDREVDSSHCDPLEKPDTKEDCRIYCPRECVVSPWTTWKECSEPCSSEDYKEVRRTVLRKPDPSSSPCPALSSVAPCVLNVTCHEHEWGFGPWGTCVLPQGAHCGEGVKERPLLCRRSDERQVDAIQCEKNHKPLSLQDPISKPCYVDCPIDCVLSEWSEWNETNCVPCSSSRAMSRKRHVVQAATDAGQPCSSTLEQFMPCSFKPCFHWQHSDWSKCNLEFAHCGFGVRRREVKCIRYDGLDVDKSYCLTVNVTFPLGSWVDPAWLASAQDVHEEELCEVSCPGDCKMSQWSEWSHCHKNCRIGQAVGYRISSRSLLIPASEKSGQVCAKLQWRTRPCWERDCDFFQWKIKNDTVVCEGRNGLIVTDGCTSLLPCNEQCLKTGGQCKMLHGHCYCDKETTPNEIKHGTPKENPCSVIPRMEFNGPHPPSNHSAPTHEIRLQYLPDDSKVSVWMYAMISVGTAFVIFVAVTVYLLCRSGVRQRSVNVERQASLRRRDQLLTSTPEHHYQNDTSNVNRHSAIQQE